MVEPRPRAVASDQRPAGVYGLQDLAWSPDGSRLVSTLALDAGGLAVLDVGSGRYERVGNTSGALTWAAGSGRLAVAGGQDESLRLAVSKPGTVSTLEDIGSKAGPPERAYRAVQFSPDGTRRVAVGRTADPRPDGSLCTGCPDATQLFVVDPQDGTVTLRSPVRSRATRFLAVTGVG